MKRANSHSTVTAAWGRFLPTKTIAVVGALVLGTAAPVTLAFAGPGKATLALPPPVPSASARAVTLPPLPIPGSAAMAPSGEVEQTPAAKTDTFLSREQILAQRARCNVTMPGAGQLQVAAAGTQQMIALEGAAGCLTAVSSDKAWLEAEFIQDALEIQVRENPSGAARRGRVTLVTPSKTFVLTITQGERPPQ